MGAREQKKKFSLKSDFILKARLIMSGAKIIEVVMDC